MRKARQGNRCGRKPLAEYQIPPSEPELDGKDRIAYTIEKLKEAPLSLKKKIADDPGCLKSGKISGKFRALNSILEEESIKEIREILRQRGGYIDRKDTAMSQKKRRRAS